VRALERAPYLDPTEPLAYYQLAAAYRQLGQRERARRARRQTPGLLARLTRRQRGR
jgi:Flp pilus assembly protein TadD